MAKDVGYIFYEGLPGSIHTGCVNTPAFNSRFCKDHEEYVCTLQVASDDEVRSAVVEEMTSGPLTRAKAKAQGATTDVEGVIEKVLDQKVTRIKTYYKVCSIWKWKLVPALG